MIMFLRNPYFDIEEIHKLTMEGEAGYILKNGSFHTSILRRGL